MFLFPSQNMFTNKVVSCAILLGVVFVLVFVKSRFMAIGKRMHLKGHRQDVENPVAAQEQQSPIVAMPVFQTLSLLELLQPVA